MTKALKYAILGSVSTVLLMGTGVYFWNEWKSLPASVSTTRHNEAPKLTKYQQGPPEIYEMLELVNAERAKHGAQPLIIDPKLNASAQYKADDMNRRHYFSHEDPQTGEKNGLKKALELENHACANVSENIRAGFPDGTINSQNSIDGWIASKSHHTAMINSKYAYTGFGIVVTKTNAYIVEHFCTPAK